MGTQDEVAAFLSSPKAFGQRVDGVEREETHISVVFLAGGYAYKMKRAVRFEYLDFSTLDRRRRYCEAEVRINLRTAPKLYLGVVAVTREAGGGLALGGEGMPVEWLVKMVRFDSQSLFDRMAGQGLLTGTLMLETAEHIAAFHTGAARHTLPGDGTTLDEVLNENERMLAAGAGTVFAPTELAETERKAREAADQCRSALDERRRAGYVRHCHGDLHLRNLCLFEGRPTLFDAIEFNERLAIVDTWFDLAFLLMDLMHRRLDGFANRVFNRYLERTGDLGGLVALPLFLSARAQIRAHVSVRAARSLHGHAAAHTMNEARTYLALAKSVLTPAAPHMAAVGGLSGTGKSVQAARLAPSLGARPGAVVLRSDVVRKRLMGVAPEDRLGPAGYAPEITDRVYAELGRLAAAALAARCAVIVDAVCARTSQRETFEVVARSAGVPFHGLWLDAPVGVRLDRVNRRRGDASDADAAVVRSQESYDAEPGTWVSIDASGTPEATAAAIARALPPDAHGAVLR